MNGVAHRFRSSADADDRFTASISEHPSPGLEERHTQEDALFSFFSNAVSVFDCFFHGMYYAGALGNPAEFPLTKTGLKKYPKAVHRDFERAWPASPLSSLLSQAVDVRCQLADVRDALTHRGCFPRHNEVLFEGHEKPAVTVINPKDHPRDWDASLVLDAETTRSHRRRLAEQLTGLLDATHKWMTSTFVA